MDFVSFVGGKCFKKNNNPLVKAIDISDLVTYYKNNPLNYFETDLQYKRYLWHNWVETELKTQNALALLWIFC